MSAPNRFVRYAYRRAPPWKPSSPSQHPFLNKTANIENSSQARLDAKYSPDKLVSWKSVKTEPIVLEPIDIPQKASVPTVAHGIKTVLRGDGLYPLEAPWSIPRQRYQRQKSNLFNDGLRRIVQPDQIAWDEIPPYVPANKDVVLHNVASETDDISFCSSTSSVTPALSTLYHIISNFSETALCGGLSAHLKDLPTSFSKMHRKPVAITLRKVSPSENSLSSNVYSVSAHSGHQRGPSILRDLGHSMERMLTTTPEEFARKYVSSIRKRQGAQMEKLIADQQPPSMCIDDSEHDVTSIQQQQYFNYTRASKFLLRAQIDCRNEENGELFDLKTRAVAPIRYDLENYGAFTSHRLRFLQGKFDSYEREFYDMVRSVFLKYALQLRIGRMGGALVAYHNTTEVLGLEYIGLSEMESYIFGSSVWAERAFATSVRFLEDILTTVARAASQQGTDKGETKVVFYNEWTNLRLYVFAQTLPEDEPDPLGVDTFDLFTTLKDVETSVAKRENSPTSFTHKMWHVDSFLHSARQGIALVGPGPQLKEFGGESINQSKELPEPRRAVPPNILNDTSERVDFDSMVGDKRLRVWEIDIAPLLNRSILSPKGVSGNMREDDDFELKYDMEEVTDIGKDHLTKLTLALSTIYLK